MAVDSKQITVNPKKTGIHAWRNGRWLVCVGKNGMTGEADIGIGSKLMAIEPDGSTCTQASEMPNRTAFIMCDLICYDMPGIDAGMVAPVRITRRGCYSAW
jgi:hypothetical protein